MFAGPRRPAWRRKYSARIFLLDRLRQCSQLLNLPDAWSRTHARMVQFWSNGNTHLVTDSAIAEVAHEYRIWKRIAKLLWQRWQNPPPQCIWTFNCFFQQCIPRVSLSVISWVFARCKCSSMLRINASRRRLAQRHLLKGPPSVSRSNIRFEMPSAAWRPRRYAAPECVLLFRWKLLKNVVVNLFTSPSLFEKCSR